MSHIFAEAADRLPKETRAKLAKAFKLLTNNPRHPSLQVKKIQGASRSDIYECRLNDAFRIILRDLGDTTYDLVYVGHHDEAIGFGAQVCEEVADYDVVPREEVPSASLGSLFRFLWGSDKALQFAQVTSSDLARWAGKSRRHKPVANEERA